jgi:hypothetical protein
MARRAVGETEGAAGVKRKRLETANVGSWVEFTNNSGNKCRGYVHAVRQPRPPKFGEEFHEEQTGSVLDLAIIREQDGKPQLGFVSRVPHSATGRPNSWKYLDNHSSNPGAIDAQEETNRKRESASSLDRL